MKFGIIGLLLGIGIMWITSMNAVNTNNANMMKMMNLKPKQAPMIHEMDEAMMQHDMSMGTSMTMDDMTAALKNKNGKDFDKTFIETMIPHHQGAIDMANLALKQAEHKEIKDLATGIIKAQQEEIDMMHEWEKAWGY